MANLQQIMAETSKTYDNSRNALQNQINAIGGQLQAQQDRINAQYAQQGKNLDQQRNWAANAATMRAGRNGGSFGGAANIANKRYYQQAYVPAVTQMQTNQANDMSQAEQQANQNRLSLERTLAGLNDEANRYAMQRYDADKAREEQLALEREKMAEQSRQFERQLAAQNRINSYFNNVESPLYQDINEGTANHQFRNMKNGNPVRFGTFTNQFGGNFNQRARDFMNKSSNADMNWLSNYIKNGKFMYTGGHGKNAYNKRYSDPDKQRAADIMNQLGIYASDWVE